MSSWHYTRKGQPQGPVDLLTLQRLAAQGDLDRAADLVWNESMTDWVPAGQVAEIFARADGPPSLAPPAFDRGANPYATPPSTWTAAGLVPARDMTLGLPEIEPGSDPIEVMTVLKRGLDLTARHFGFLLVLGLVYIGTLILSTLILTAMDLALGLGGVKGFDFDSFAESSDSPLNRLLSEAIGIYLSVGITRIGLNLVSGKPVSIGQLFSGGRLFWRAAGGYLIFMVAFALGLLLLVVPGVYLALRYGQYLAAMVDRDLGIMESFEYSSKITLNNKGNLLGLFMMSILVVLAGMLALLVGLAFAGPMIWLAGAVAYRWMQHGRRAAYDHPGTQTPLLA